jgi:hypothetical protein
MIESDKRLINNLRWFCRNQTLYPIYFMHIVVLIILLKGLIAMEHFAVYWFSMVSLFTIMYANQASICKKLLKVIDNLQDEIKSTELRAAAGADGSAR